MAGDHSDILVGVRLILFDLDGTLRHSRPSGHEAMISYSADLGHSFGLEEQQAGLRWSHWYWADSDLIKYDLERFGEDEFWANYVQEYLRAMKLGEEYVQETTRALAERFLNDFKPVGYVLPGTKELLWKLKKRHYKLGLVSNRHKPLTGVAIELGIIDHFDFTLAAGQVNSWKPDALIFERALDLAGHVLPGEAVCVGDNYYTDIVGARGAGLRAILVDEHGAFTDVQDECLVLQNVLEIERLIFNSNSRVEG